MHINEFSALILDSEYVSSSDVFFLLKFKSRLLELFKIIFKGQGESPSLKNLTFLAYFKLWNRNDLYQFTTKVSDDENLQVFKFDNNCAHLFGEGPPKYRYFPKLYTKLSPAFFARSISTFLSWAESFWFYYLRADQNHSLLFLSPSLACALGWKQISLQ